MNLLPYRDFVKKKEAPPREMSVTDFRLMHAALGLSSEYLELQLAGSTENTREELEDLCWYLMLTADILEYNVDVLPESLEDGAIVNEDDLLNYLEQFVSLVKKHTIYGKDKLDVLRPTFFLLWRSFLYQLHLNEYPLDQAIHNNRLKLDVRYPDSFSQEESEMRRDKQ